MTSQFCRILDKFTRRTKPIRIIGDPDNQRPDKGSSTVPISHILLECGLYFVYVHRTTCLYSDLTEGTIQRFNFVNSTLDTLTQFASALFCFVSGSIVSFNMLTHICTSKGLDYKSNFFAILFKSLVLQPGASTDLQRRHFTGLYILDKL